MAKIFVCGDIVNDGNHEDFIGLKLKKVINSADYAVANLEGVELAEGQKLKGHPFQKAGTIEYLKDSGFNLMLLANNHITDGGSCHLKYTIDRIDSLNLDRIGAGFSWEETYKPLIREIQGVKIAFFNVCEAQIGHYESPHQDFGYAWIGNKKLLKDITTTKEKVDHVMVFVHMGLEHYDIPLPEVREFYRDLCDAGASCVVGCHPHIAQGYEYYNKNLIIYSLGNFFFKGGEKYKSEAYSYSVVLGLEKEDNVKINTISHFNNGNEVDLTECQIDFNELNSKLAEKYNDCLREMIVSAYNSLCKRLIYQATCGQNEKDNLKNVFNKNLRYVFRRKKMVIDTFESRQLLLLRLFENETYRYLIKRYLKYYRTL